MDDKTKVITLLNGVSFTITTSHDFDWDNQIDLACTLLQEVSYDLQGFIDQGQDVESNIRLRNKVDDAIGLIE